MPGGVCAVLDYDVEFMAEYVAEMSTRLALGKCQPSDTFRKFISQILSSTRLPRTTILLGMNYFAKRINMMSMMSPTGKLSVSDGHVWRMLTVALLLGSKFLDDNTFQNRSWADVSGIPVRELNTMERDWMESISWCLYVNLDRSEDYNAWINSWNEWDAAKKRHQAISAHDRLTSLMMPVDSDVGNSHAYASWHQQQVAEYERLSRLKRGEQSLHHGYRIRDLTWSYQPPVDAWSSAPLTPPDSGYGTPDYINSATSVNLQYNDWFNQQAQQAASRVASNGSYGRPQYLPPVTGNPTPYHSRNIPAKLPTYNFYGHNIWEHSVDSGIDCIPHGHQMKQGTYFGFAHPYGQPVVG